MNCFFNILIGRQRNSVQTIGFMDTGNTLKDISTGKNVIVAPPEIMYELLPVSLHNILNDYTECRHFFDRKSAIFLPEGMHLVPYHTINTTSELMLAFDCDFFFINNSLIKEKPLVGVSRGPLCINNRECVLLNSVYMRKVKKNDKHNRKSRL